MVLARNTYRFGLLVIGYAIAEGIDTMGGHGAARLAVVGFGIGAVGLFGGTLAHLARGPGGDRSARDGGDGGDGQGGADGADEAEGDDGESSAVHSYGWY